MSTKTLATKMRRQNEFDKRYSRRTDLHIDIECKLGSNANRSRPVCCHDGIPKPGELGARFWGDYHTYFLTKIYSCVGDHEPTPSDLFPTDNISWLYSNLASQWTCQLGLDEQTRDTILKGDYSTTIILPKLCLISLNMNHCTNNNCWLFINSTDPLG
ncbi:unnamed protein product [Rotaria sp. Silwood2]|nr:unnamed protein product [Rotaria sp. Silwood2]